VWRSTSAIHLSGLAQIEKGIDSLARADTEYFYSYDEDSNVLKDCLIRNKMLLI